jgi:ABC-2 type transport system permease protein
MAVYKRTYRGYAGVLTPAWSRFLVLYRFARQNMFRSRFQTGFFTVCFFFPLLCLLGIYANAHLSAFSFLKRSEPFLKVDGSFFYVFTSVQSTLAFLLTAFLGPGLISPDLANGALSLYLCRPLSRGEYVLGKMSVLIITLSWITWVPGVILFFTQAAMTSGWMMANLNLLIGVLIGSFLWILVLSLLSLALSAWVKWRVVAGALLLAVFFMGAGFGSAINGVLLTQQGYLIDIARLISIVEVSFFRDGTPQSFSPIEASIALLIFASCCLLLLMRKVRPNEVIE